MTWPRLHMSGRAARLQATREDRTFEPFATSEQVLLCCFGLDQSARRSGAQLREALVGAGFSLPGACAIVRVSPLVRRTSGGFYRLRSLDARRFPTEAVEGGAARSA
jgi:hypothetical protein